MSFLPTDYQAPKATGGYMKIQPGENKIRILCKPILGWRDWMEVPGGGNKPLRFKMDKKPDKPINPIKPISHFWAFIVWNYKEEKIQILELTQSTIQKSIQNFSTDSDWGAPFFYDIKIFKAGDGAKTTYTVNPVAPKELDSRVKVDFMAFPVNLEALYSGADPFADVTEDKRTKAFWEIPEEPSVATAVKHLSSFQAEELNNLISLHISKADPKWRENFFKHCGISDTKDLSVERYIWAKKQIENKIESIKKTQEDFDEIPF